MKDKDAILLLLVLGGAWYFYTRQRGLSLTGTYENPMLAPGYGGAMSTVGESGTASANATNVFSAISRAISGIVTSIAGAGNTSARPATSPYAAAGTVGPLAGNPGVASVGDVAPIFDPSLANYDPWWVWGGNADLYHTISVPDMSGSNQAGQLNVSPDFDWRP